MFSYLNINNLLNLNKKSRILFHGPGLNEWHQSFSEKYEDCFYDSKQTIKEWHQKDYLFELIIFSTFNLTTKELEAKLKEISLFLKPDGFIFLLGSNRYNIKNISKKYLLRRKIKWQFFTSQREASYRKYLKACGFENILGFTTLIADNDYNKNTLIRRITSYRNKLLCFDLLTAISVSHFLFIANRNKVSSIEELLNYLQSVIIDSSVSRNVIEIDKIEFRYRGALIIYLRNQRTSDEFITRSSSSEHVNAIILENVKNINTIREIEGIPNAIINKLPVQIGMTQYGDNKFYIEERKQGKLAWLMANQDHQLDKIIFKNAVGFITLLERATKKELTLTQKLFNQIYRLNFDKIYNQDYIGSEIMDKYNRIVDKLEGILLDKKQILVLSHGDYGYGNILVDRRGNVTGVIDWDAAKPYNIPGYDLFNLVFTRYGMRTKKKYSTLLDDLGRQSIKTGRILISSDGTYEKEFNIDKTNICIVLATFCISWVSSGARYEAIFNNSRSNIIYFFDWTLKNCL